MFTIGFPPGYPCNINGVCFSSDYMQELCLQAGELLNITGSSADAYIA